MDLVQIGIDPTGMYSCSGTPEAKPEHFRESAFCKPKTVLRKSKKGVES